MLCTLIEAFNAWATNHFAFDRSQLDHIITALKCIIFAANCKYDFGQWVNCITRNRILNFKNALIKKKSYVSKRLTASQNKFLFISTAGEFSCEKFVNKTSSNSLISSQFHQTQFLSPHNNKLGENGKLDEPWLWNECAGFKI